MLLPTAGLNKDIQYHEWGARLKHCKNSRSDAGANIHTLSSWVCERERKESYLLGYLHVF